MATISEALAIAFRHHQAGGLQAAEQIYRQILAVEPHQADAWHLLGIVNAQTGNYQRAAECIYRALAVKPDWPEAHSNLGNALKDAGEAGRRRRLLPPRPGTEAGLCRGTL